MDTKAPDVDRVIRKVLAGEIDVYVEIVRHYQRDVWRVVAAMLPDVRPDTLPPGGHTEGRARTEDLVQEAFVDAYENLHRFERGRDFSPWLKSIARNVVRQELRKKSRESLHLEVYRKRLAARLADDEAASRHEDLRAAALAECRRKLPGDSARALQLRYAKSLGFEDIARALGRTVAATRQLLSRARLSLKDCIQRRLAQT